MLFTPLVTRVFHTIIVPILGITFLPFSTLVYALVWNPLGDANGQGWVWVILAFFLRSGSVRR